MQQQFDDQYLQTTVRQFVSSAIDALVERFPSASFVEAVHSGGGTCSGMGGLST